MIQPESAYMKLTAQQRARLGGLRGRDFLRLHDYSPEEISDLTALASILKQHTPQNLLAGKSVALIFVKPSTRTRVSFEVGVQKLGGNAVVLNATDSQIGRGEPIKDMARVLSGYVDAIMIRTFAHSDVEELAHYSSVPVVNGLTDTYHPCQALADILTIQEHLGTLRGKRLVYIGDGNNMAHSLLFAGAKTGMHITICCPEGYEPQQNILELAKADALPNTELQVSRDPLTAAKGADVLYTDVWASMGQEAEKAQRVAAFKGYQINSEVMAEADSGCIVLHCLPAHRGEEITDEVIEGSRSVVFDQAANRLYAQNAVLVALMGAVELLS